MQGSSLTNLEQTLMMNNAVEPIWFDIARRFLRRKRSLKKDGPAVGPRPSLNRGGVNSGVPKKRCPLNARLAKFPQILLNEQIGLVHIAAQSRADKTKPIASERLSKKISTTVFTPAPKMCQSPTVSTSLPVERHALTCS